MPDSTIPPSRTRAAQLVSQYIEAFNARDAGAMAAVFDPDLTTVHPDEPDIDVVAAAPFLERMGALWPRQLHYELRRIVERPTGQGSEAWAELVIGRSGEQPLAAEVVIYEERGGRVVRLTVYKQMHPSHALYQPDDAS